MYQLPKVYTPEEAFDDLTGDIEDLETKPWLRPAIMSHLTGVYRVAREDAAAVCNKRFGVTTMKA